MNSYKIHSFILQAFTKHLVFASHCSKIWENSNKQKRPNIFAQKKPTFQKGKTDSKKDKVKFL